MGATAATPAATTVTVAEPRPDPAPGDEISLPDRKGPGRLRLALLLSLAAVLFCARVEADDDCRGRHEGSWTPIEKAAWEDLRKGETFDAGQLEDRRERVLRADFLLGIFTCEALQGELPQQGVALKGAVMPETVDLGLLDVPVRFSCHGCVFARIAAQRSRWRKPLVLDDSILMEGFDFSFARFDDEFRARKLKSSSKLLLDQALVARNLDLMGAESEGPLSLRDGEVGEKLRLDGAKLASLELGGTEVAGQLVMSGISIRRRAVLDRMKIGGNLLLRSYENSPKPGIGLDYPLPEAGGRAQPRGFVLLLNNTEIGGRLEIAQAHIRGPVSLDAIRVDEDIWLRDCSRVEGPIEMPFARIGQNLDLSTTILQSVNATGSKIEGELRLGATGSARLTPPVWGEGAKVVLRNVSVSAWVDAADGKMPRNGKCPPIEARTDPWPPRIDVIGFSYERAGGFGGGTETERPGRWYVAWLDRQEPFSLDPYRRLARFLRRNGRESTAKAVLFAAKDRQLGRSGGLTAALLFLQKIFVGYGIYVWFVFPWVIGFILLGGFVFPRSEEAKTARVPLRFAYSTDMFLPFVQLRKAHGEIELEGPYRYYLYFHKFMGWICASFFLSALAGLFEV